MSHPVVQGFFYNRAHANEAKKEANAIITVEGVAKKITVRSNYISRPLQPRPPEAPLPQPRDPLLHDQVVAALVDIPDPGEQGPDSTEENRLECSSTCANPSFLLIFKPKLKPFSTFFKQAKMFYIELGPCRSSASWRWRR